jgi:hypothetical protein
MIDARGQRSRQTLIADQCVGPPYSDGTFTL